MADPELNRKHSAVAGFRPAKQPQQVEKQQNLLIAGPGTADRYYSKTEPDPYPYRACPEKLEPAKAKARKDENGFLESQRPEIDGAAELAGLEIRFPFSLCSRR